MQNFNRSRISTSSKLLKQIAANDDDGYLSLSAEKEILNLETSNDFDNNKQLLENYETNLKAD